MKTRNLKVYEVYVPYQTNSNQTKYKKIPRIILQGKWLEKAGFSPNSKIYVEVRNKELIIKED